MKNKFMEFLCQFVLIVLLFIYIYLNSELVSPLHIVWYLPAPPPLRSQLGPCCHQRRLTSS